MCDDNEIHKLDTHHDTIHINKTKQTFSCVLVWLILNIILEKGK